MENFPKVDILMAIYKPNLKWLEEQLISLNNQTYKELNLIVWNDCPDDNFNYDVFLKKYINKFKFKIYKGKNNFGSNKAFEKLTKLATGQYIAYCDQDDIWLPEKINVLVKYMIKSKADLICSDMYVIDKKGKIVADKITKVRPHQIFYKGTNLFGYLFSKNFVTGCTTLVNAEFAKKTLPFPKEYVHDWWLALNAAANGKLEIVEDSLIKYRIHDTNQTGILSGVNTKKDYYDKRIKLVKNRSEILLERFADCKNINKFAQFAIYRTLYYQQPNFKNFYNLFKFRYLNKLTTYFELIMPILPEFIFKFIINQIRKGNI